MHVGASLSLIHVVATVTIVKPHPQLMYRASLCDSDTTGRGPYGTVEERGSVPRVLLSSDREKADLARGSCWLGMRTPF